MIVAIDGPSGAGKSTMARMLAEHYGIGYLDTGALFRALAFASIERGENPLSSADNTKLLAETKVTVDFIKGKQHTFLNGEDVSAFIRTSPVAKRASDISTMLEIRNYVMELERSLANQQSFVLDGRDIGTVVLPDCPFKFFLTASSDARAKRRWLEFQGKGNQITYDEVLAEINYRDAQDSTRSLAPTKPAADAIIIDSTTLTANEVIAMMVNHIDTKTNAS